MTHYLKAPFILRDTQDYQDITEYYWKLSLSLIKSLSDEVIAEVFLDDALFCGTHLRSPLTWHLWVLTEAQGALRVEQPQP